MKIRVGIMGATGFTAGELFGLLLGHPQVEIVWLSSESQSGTGFEKAFPRFALRMPKNLSKMVSPEVARTIPVDVVFSCLPHAASAEHVKPYLDGGKTRVVDLSADFRLSSAEIYAATYKNIHPYPHLLKDAVYGLSEIYGPQIAKATLVANPGCYATSAQLPLIPLLKAGVIQPTNIVVDAKSGVSGAGRKASEGTHYVFCNENFSAYMVGDTHRHLPEIRQQLEFASGSNIEILFTPHLVPMERGILATIYVDLMPGKTAAHAEACLDAQYESSVFVRRVTDFPKTADVARTNECRISAYQPKGMSKLILVSVLDNMVKGASGQALQNMNIMFGLNPALGLVGA